MAIPTQPTNLLPRPFAADGTHQIIPDAPSMHGRASFQNGFPEETQLPLALGGVAPSRTDFNGIFNLLSAFAFWQQSGGMFNYVPTLNYSTPAVVYHKGSLWWCVAPNGVDVAGVGAKEPGTNENYWVEFFKKLTGGSNNLGVPVGMVLTYYGVTAPNGFFACDGSAFSASTYPLLYKALGKATTPDFRGYFMRGYDTRNNVDPDGAQRGIGSVQGDAIRNITGWLLTSGGSSGAFVNGGSSPQDLSDNTNDKAHYTYFDASRVVPVADENRTKNVCLLYCIKHD